MRHSGLTKKGGEMALISKRTVPFEHPALTVVGGIGLMFVWLPIIALFAHVSGLIHIGTLHDIAPTKALTNIVVGPSITYLGKVISRAIYVSLTSAVASAVIYFSLLRIKVRRASLWLSLLLAISVMLSPVCRVGRDGIKRS
ncbi:MAG: hypothetical protein WDN28_03155 [Chthoniobacter sp.]